MEACLFCSLEISNNAMNCIYVNCYAKNQIFTARCKTRSWQLDKHLHIVAYQKLSKQLFKPFIMGFASGGYAIY